MFSLGKRQAELSHSVTIWAFKSCILAKMCEDHETVDRFLDIGFIWMLTSVYCHLNLPSELKFSSCDLFTVKIHLVVCLQAI